MAFRLRPKGWPRHHRPRDRRRNRRGRRHRQSQGFSQRLTAADRKAIETRAKELATAHYEALGYIVTDVSKTHALGGCRRSYATVRTEYE
jgi:hypothetical protein